MTLSWSDWRAIQDEIESQIKSSHGPFFAQGEVIRSDSLKNLVWLGEFGDQPIPVFGFSYTIKYYDTKNDGTTQVRKVTVTPDCPKVGDTVLVARMHGSRRLPKCLGVLHSTDFVVPE